MSGLWFWVDEWFVGLGGLGGWVDEWFVGLGGLKN